MGLNGFQPSFLQGRKTNVHMVSHRWCRWCYSHQHCLGPDGIESRWHTLACRGPWKENHIWRSIRWVFFFLSLHFTSLEIAGSQDIGGVGRQERLVFYDLRFWCNSLLINFLTVMVGQINYEATVTLGCDERGPENGHIDSLLLWPPLSLEFFNITATLSLISES